MGNRSLICLLQYLLASKFYSKVFFRKFLPVISAPRRFMASDIRAPTDSKGRVREKVSLKKGFHLMDWVKLSQAASDMSGRNGGPLLKITSSELKRHNSEFDCWTAYNGKVYNITQYIPYHPGGYDKIMMGAGRDCTNLFNKYHRWVNIDSMLSKCLVGILIEESTILEESDEDIDCYADSKIETKDDISEK